MSLAKSLQYWHADRGKLREAFGRAAADYLAVTPVQEAVARRLLSGVERPAIGSVLDVASGPGRLGRLWPGPRPRPFIELDLSPEMLRAGCCGDERRQVCGEAERLPFADSTFALTVCSSSLQWFRPADRFAAELARVLAEGGRFHLAFLADGSLPELAEATAAVLDSEWRMRFPEVGEVISSLRRVGLTVHDHEVDPMITRADNVLGFLKKLRLTGAGYSGREANPFAGRPGRVRQLVQHYTSRFGDADGSVQVTYRWAYVRGAK